MKPRATKKPHRPSVAPTARVAAKARAPRKTQEPASPIDWTELARAAFAVREQAYAPYSAYRVGAALLGEDGKIDVACNVENASYGLCLCAERGAVAAAVARGVQRFRAICVASGGDTPATPCGMCRQVLAEFAPTFPVLSISTSGATVALDTAQLLPFGFDPTTLARGRRK